MEAHRYSALPILTKQGRYAGTLTEGDLLWYMKSHMNQSLKDMELISVMEVNAPSGQQSGKRRSKDGRSAG